MNVNRRDFIGGTLAALGFSALPGGLIFAAPPGWKHGGKPNLVFGVVSDTHLRTANKGNGIGANWPDKYFAAALEYFKAQGVDAVVHCGDFAHRGQVREMEFHAEAWRRVFADGREPEKLFVAGNHDLLGADYGDFVKNRYPDEAERVKHVLATDMAANWERIWGEKYELVWHKEVKGYHFFGRQWGVDEGNFAKFLHEQNSTLNLAEGIKPFFLLSHARSHKAIYKTAGKMRNSVSFFGHWHHSAANWNKIYFWGCPNIQVPCCEPRGGNGLAGEGQISKATLEGREACGKSRQGYVVRVYDDMLTIERREFGAGGSLGADWVMPFGKYDPHPFSKGELKKVIGNPQFRKGAKLEVELEKRVGVGEMDNSTLPLELKTPTVLRVKIPLADGNPDSRVYAYEVVVAGEGAPKFHKAVYAAGVNMGIGYEPNGGVTTLDIPKSELPPGKTLIIAARPLSSLGTSGKPIATTFKS